ncbi:hypothetical protein NE237_031084 [Protea cynaroides]|uniref:F-box domain-containing protein n=1 Tax=Protea cynaroides TaxID=273540 RepID=A0A9Q0R261_9MAGN|nr:hypothetical protein NE237_031084 [Protea cynaroides]
MDTEGLLLEVLSRMSAKSILRLTSLSKTCSNFPSENFFLKNHSQQLLYRDDLGFFIQQDQRGGKVELHTLSSNEDKKNFDDYGVPHSSLDFLYNTTNKILGSCNGLLVLKKTNEEDMGLFLCNPATQKICSIPKLMTNINNDQSTFGVHIVSNNGATEFPDNYGVIMVKSAEDWLPYSIFYMYIKGEEWKEMAKLNTGARNIIYDMPVYCRGAIHFISDTFPYLTKASPDYKPYIVACDTDKVKSWRINLPKEAMRNSHDQSCVMRIFKWGKPSSLSSQSSICLVRLRKSVFMAWVLNDYDVGLWILVLNTRVRAMGLREPEPVVCGFTIINGDCLIFATQQWIYCYRPTLSYGRLKHSVKAEEISRHGLGGCATHLCFTNYSNTLRPCGSSEVNFDLATIEKSLETEENCRNPNAQLDF